MNTGRNKREEKKSIYIDVKKEEESWSESSYPGLKTAESTSGRSKQKQKLNLRKKEAEETKKSKSKNRKVDTVCNDNKAGTSSLVPEFKLTIKKSHLLFLVRQARQGQLHTVELVLYKCVQI